MLDGAATTGVLRVDGGKRRGTGTLTVTNDFDTPGNAFFVGTG